MKRLELLAGAGVTMVLAPATGARFLGTTTEMVFDKGVVACRVYAEFDDPEDRLLAVVGTPHRALAIETPGTFYQHAFGSDTAPLEAIIGAFPSLAYDTFVTIGTLAHAGDDETRLTPQWPGFGPSSLLGADVGWFVPPGAAQAAPDASGRVALGQFSTQDSLFLAGGPIAVLVVSDGETELRYTGFCHHPYGFISCAPMDLDFDTVVGIHDFLMLLAVWGPCTDKCEFCLPDVDGNGDCVVGIEELLLLLANWTGPPPPLPEDADADLDGDGVVGETDLDTLRACWGPVTPGCEASDLEPDGDVGTRDLLVLLRSWTP